MPSIQELLVARLPSLATSVHGSQGPVHTFAVGLLRVEATETLGGEVPPLQDKSRFLASVDRAETE
jgi:hypothetical protein